jgi:lysine-N-methylase
MWRADGLCRIQAELGHDALCKTCREFPRLTHDYGDFIECGLELSCPEAARLILTGPAAPFVVAEISGGEAPEYDKEAMAILLQTRKKALSLLSDPDYTVPQALTLLLFWGYQAQALLDGEDAPEFDEATILSQAAELAAAGDISSLLQFFSNLEILTPAWRQRLQAPSPAPWTDLFRNLARYGVERYWLQAVSDYDLIGRAKLLIGACLLVYRLGGDFIETAQLLSKEIENDPDNLDAILDGAYTSPALTDVQLLSLLMNG